MASPGEAVIISSTGESISLPDKTPDIRVEEVVLLDGNAIKALLETANYEVGANVRFTGFFITVSPESSDPQIEVRWDVVPTSP